MELYSKHLDGIFFLEPIGVELETSLTVKVAWVFFQVTVFENLLKLGFPFSHPNFFPMGMGKIGNCEIFPWEFLGIFQNRKNAKKRTFLIALLFLLFFFQSLFPFKVTS